MYLPAPLSRYPMPIYTKFFHLLIYSLLSYLQSHSPYTQLPRVICIAMQLVFQATLNLLHLSNVLLWLISMPYKASYIFSLPRHSLMHTLFYAFYRSLVFVSLVIQLCITYINNLLCVIPLCLFISMLLYSRNVWRWEGLANLANNPN